MELKRWSEIREANPEGLDLPVSFSYGGGGMIGDIYHLGINGEGFNLPDIIYPMGNRWLINPFIENPAPYVMPSG